MAPRFDPERLTLDLAVADLLEGHLLRNLGFANRGGYERLWLGQAIHSRYQEQALAEDPTYRREVFVAMSFGVVGVLYFIGIKDQPGAFWGFFGSFLFLFFVTGVGNASTFQMIPAIMRKEMSRLMPNADAAERVRHGDKESAAIIGFTSAIAAYGAFFIPKAYGTSIATTGGPEAALWAFLIFYVSCLVITWQVYTRPGGLLFDVERGRSGPALKNATA